MRDPNHIAFFVASLNIGGVESVFLTYSEMLSERGYHVDFIVTKAQGALLSKLSSKVVLINFGGIKMRNSMPSLRKYIKHSTVSTIITGPDVTNFLSILVNLSFKPKNRINLIVSQHNVFDQDSKDLGLIGRLIPLGKRVLYRYASTVLSVSNAVTENLMQGGVPQRKIATIYNPISLKKIEALSEESLQIDLPDNYIAFVGRFYAVKNLPLLIKAFELLHDNSLYLVVVGDGPLKDEWMKLAQQSCAKERILFTGTLMNPAPVIKRARVIAIPSLSEAFPMVVVEAAALGRTIVHTPNPGSIEILGSDHGYCSEQFDNPVEFASKLKEALNRPIPSDCMINLVAKLDEVEIIGKLINYL